MLKEPVKHIFTLGCPVNMFTICPIQKANGLNLKMKGARYSSLLSRMVLGFSCHPQTLLNYGKTLGDRSTKMSKGSQKSEIINLNYIR